MIIIRRKAPVFLLLLLVFASVGSAQPLPPDRIVNPGGLQYYMDAAYNSELDEYLLAYAGDGFPLALRLGTDGSVIGTQIGVGGQAAVGIVGLAYNPDRNEYLFIFRSDSGSVFGRYLTGDGVPIGTRFFIAVGSELDVVYGTGNQIYVLALQQAGPKVSFFAIDGDSTTTTPVVNAGTVQTSAFDPTIAYGSVSNKYLIAFSQDFAPPTKANINGKLLNGNATVLSGLIGIATGGENQQGAEAAYSSSNDRFLVTFEAWERVGANSADVGGHYVDSNGAVSSRFYPVATGGSGGWDQPGPVTYNSSTDKFVVTSFYATIAYWREVDPVDQSLGPLGIVAFNPSFPTAATARPNPADPQALVLTRTSNGGDGVHAHIVHLPAPPPSFTGNQMPDGFLNSAYSEMLPVVGGTQPLTYQITSGSLPSGLSGPNANGVISGTPLLIETKTITVEVTDADSRSVTGDVTIAIKLAPPTPTSPVGGIATNDATPTFAWNAPPSAGPFTYNLQVDNVTTGTPNVINQTGISTTGFTPGSPLQDGVHVWRVQAVRGGDISPFSADQTFELDTDVPDPVTLTATVPVGLNQIFGLTAVSTSGELSSFVKENAVDGDLNTFWAGPFRGTPNVDEQITVDLGSERLVGQVRLHPRVDTQAAFPRDFEILASTDNVSFTTVRTVSDFVASSATWYPFDVSPTTARYIRIRTTEASLFGVQYDVQIAEIQAYESAPQFGTIRLDWPAPAEDDTGGAVAELDIRYQVGTTINFATATQVVGEPAPQPPGTPQFMVITGLLDETTYTFAGRAIDNAGNPSPVLASATATTVGIPPGAIVNLSAADPTLTTIDLSWSAPGEDGGAGGPVTSYEVRYSENPITEENFGAATLVGSGVPSPPAAPLGLETMTVTGLAHTTSYYLAVRSIDNVGNLSPISNVVMASTLDGTPPAPVSNLTASSTASSNLNNISPLTIAGSSGFAGTLVDTNAVDGDPATIWASPFSNPMQQEFITVDLGSVKTIGRVRLLSRADTALAFPRDFQIQVSPDNVTFTTVLNVDDFDANVATWYAFDFSMVDAQFVKILVTESNQFGVNYNVQLAEIQVYEVELLPDGILVQWVSSGNDGNVGTADSYEIRYATFEINDTNFGSATLLTNGVPDPEPAGTTQSVVLSGFGPETLVYVGIKAIDDAGNASDLATTSGSTQGTPPDPVTDLQAISSTASSVRLRWTATADDGSTGSPADHYDLRVATVPITTMAQFNAAVPVPAPVPATPGTQQQTDVTGLSSDVLFYFALIVVDDVGNKSGLSNSASRTTLDVLPPARITDLAAQLVPSSSNLSVTAVSSSGDLSSFVKTNAVDGDLNTFWSSPFVTSPLAAQQITFDIGEIKAVSKVRLHPRLDTTAAFPRDFDIQVSTDNVSFSTVHSESDFTANVQWYEFPFTPVDARYVRVRVTELNAFGIRFAAMIAEAEVHAVNSGNVKAELTWTATGDNADVGAATSYTVGWSLFSDFSSPVIVGGAPTPPQSSGAQETMIVEGLPGEDTVYLGVIATDEAGNDSPLSNLPSVVTPSVAPAAITDLTATTVDQDSIQLLWTLVGDDGTGGGAATAYDFRYDTAPIMTLADFNGATPILSGVPAPAAPPGQQSFNVNGLTPDTTYYFAGRVADDLANLSPVSNSASAKTADNVAPDPITDLAATVVDTNFSFLPATAVSASSSVSTFFKENATDGDLNTFWGAALRTTVVEEQITVDVGGVFQVGRVRLHPRLDTTAAFPRDFDIQVSLDNVTFFTVHSEADFVPGSATWYAFDFPKVNARYIRIRVTETSSFGIYKTAQIAEIEAYEALPGNIQLTWTSTGDSGGTGTASSYQIRATTSPVASPVTESAFNAASPVPGVPPSPQAPGNPESFSVEGLSPGTYYFIVKVTDDSGNFAFSDPAASATIAP